MRSGIRPLFFLFFCLFLSSSCSLSRRVHRVLYPNTFLLKKEDRAPYERLVDVDYFDGYSDEFSKRYSPQEVKDEEDENEGGRFVLITPPVLSKKGWIDVMFRRCDADVRLYIRNRYRFSNEFFNIKSVTGEVDSNITPLIHFFEPTATVGEKRRFYIEDLRNPLNDYVLEHGDLILIEVEEHETNLVERYLFKFRETGLKGKVGISLLYNIAGRVWGESEGIDTGALSLTLSFSTGYRFATTNPFLLFIGDNVSLIFSVGIGTFLIKMEDIESTVSGLIGNMVSGIGIEFYDFISINYLYNSTAFINRDVNASTIAVAIDTYRASIFTRNMVRKLFISHRLKLGEGL